MSVNGYWWCPACQEEVPGAHVTNSEHHDRCGVAVDWMDPPEDVETLKVLAEIRSERQRQEKKWGQQNHDMADYYTILGEEFGEVGKAICEHKLQCMAPAMRIRNELIHTAAVAVAMVEAFDRAYPKAVKEPK